MTGHGTYVSTGMDGKKTGHGSLCEKGRMEAGGQVGAERTRDE